MSYAVNDEGRFDPEYAEVYGVPFSFIPSSGSAPSPKPLRPTTWVRALDDRRRAEISFPRVQGYRQELGDAPLRAAWSAESRLTVTTADVPSITESAPLVGEIAIHDLDQLKRQRRRTVEFELVSTARDLWVPAVNNEGAFGRWAFLEVLNPWKCEQEIRDLVLSLREERGRWIGGTGCWSGCVGDIATMSALQTSVT